MKKLSVLVLLIAIAVTGMFVYRIQANGGVASGPWVKQSPLQNLSRAAEATEPSLLVIGQSKQEIMRLSPEGIVEAEIKHTGMNGDSRRDFTEAVVDGTNWTIVLDTVLDSYGLYVMNEQIIRYDDKGKSPEVLYDWQGNGASKRIGQLKGLQISGDTLYFYIVGAEKVVLMQQPLSGGKAVEAFTFPLPQDRYISEIEGFVPGQIFYTTKRGGIFQVAAEGTDKLLYPLATMDQTRKNFPERLSMASDGSLLFIDRLVNSVNLMVPAGQSYSLKTILDEEALIRATPGADSYEIMDVLLKGDGGHAVVLNDRVLSYDNNNRLTAVLTQVKYQQSMLFQAWLLWIAAFAGVLLLIFAIRMVYVHLMNRRFSLFIKQVVVTVPIIVICMLLLSNFIYNSFSARMEVQMQRELTLLARNGQHLIDGERLERLHSPEDYRNPDYEAIRANMSFLFEGEQAADRQGLYSTLYKYEEGQLYIIMDDDDGVNIFKPFEMNEENEAVRNNGTVFTGQWEDSDGKWLYAMGPVYNKAGEFIGIYETGRDLGVLYQENQKIYRSILQNIVIITSILLGIILLATFLMLSGVRKLRRSVIEMADGNWDVVVDVKSRDEVGDLGEQFNRMGRYIQQYIGDITVFSEASYRFVPQQFFKSLGKKGILDIHLGDQVQQNMPVMVANLRDFRKLSQTLTPMENFNFMNSFLKRFGPLVRKEEGLISKYLGAGFMALFPGYAEEALKTAIAIRQELTEYNAGRGRAGYVPVDIGIAIHKGPLMMGIIGEERRWEGNVISDDVHLTATLEKMSEDLGASILVTRDLFEQLREPERFRHRSLGRVTPEGQEVAIELIDVYEGDSEQQRQAKDRTKAIFERGLLLCQEGRFYDARETFVEVLKQNRMDKAAKLYFYLCDEYYQKGTSSGWNGTLAV
jgi:adenylate cyclase